MLLALAGFVSYLKLYSYVLEVNGLVQEVDTAGGLVGVANFRKSLFIFETNVRFQLRFQTKIGRPQLYCCSQLQ